MSLNGKDHAGSLWLIALITACTLLFATITNQQLSFDRAMIADGEVWRLITGNLAHTNLWHLLINLAGLCITYGLFRDHLGQANLPILMLLLWLAVGLGIWWWCPNTGWYMGLSGSLYGLFVWGAVQDIHRGRTISGCLLLSAVVLKLVIDSAFADTTTSILIDARVHIESHIIGAASGLLLGLVMSEPARSLIRRT